MTVRFFRNGVFTVLAALATLLLTLGGAVPADALSVFSSLGDAVVNIYGSDEETGADILQAAVADFEAETGIRPFVYLTESIDGETDPDAEAPSAFCETQLSMLGDAPAFVLTALWRDGGFVWARCIANEAAADRMDEDACRRLQAELTGITDEWMTPGEIVADALWLQRSLLVESDETYHGYVGNGETGYYYVLGDEAGEAEAERFLQEQIYGRNDQEVIEDLFAFLPLIFLPIAAVIAVIVKKEKADRQAAASRTPTATPAAPVQPANYEPVRYPITCPGCAATAYPNEDGTCQYCGRALIPRRK